LSCNAALPTATLLFAVVLLKRALLPIAILLDPVEFAPNLRDIQSKIKQ
jgi:hypothetical protein